MVVCLDLFLGHVGIEFLADQFRFVGMNEQRTSIILQFLLDFLLFVIQVFFRQVQDGLLPDPVLHVRSRRGRAIVVGGADRDDPFEVFRKEVAVERPCYGPFTRVVRLPS